MRNIIISTIPDIPDKTIDVCQNLGISIFYDDPTKVIKNILKDMSEDTPILRILLFTNKDKIEKLSENCIKTLDTYKKAAFLIFKSIAPQENLPDDMCFLPFLAETATINALKACYDNYHTLGFLKENMTSEMQALFAANSAELFDILANTMRNVIHVLAMSNNDTK